LGGKLEGHQEENTCGGKPAGLQDEAGEKGRKDSNHNPVKNHDPKFKKECCIILCCPYWYVYM
jgi:hypothetical protein